MTRYTLIDVSGQQERERGRGIGDAGYQRLVHLAFALELPAWRIELETIWPPGALTS